MKATVAELRAQNVKTMSEKYHMTLKEAAHISNCYYRMCGLCERRLNYDNDSYRYSEKVSDRLYKLQDEAEKRLNGKLERFGLIVIYYGYLPSIVERCTLKDAFTSFFYN